MSGMSLSGYARHRGCRLSSVQEAISSGRLRKSLTPEGKIRDAKEADAEWAATTKTEMRPLTGPAAEGRGKKKKGKPESGIDFADARARHELADAITAEIELAQLRGQLVLAADVEQRLVEVFSQCRTKLLAVPARARQQDPGLTVGQLSLLEDLIRESLEDLAGPRSAGEAA
jgi:hypothetical protein